MGLRQAPSFSGSDGKQTVCAVACAAHSAKAGVVYLEKWQSGVGGWLHRLMLITGLVASREIWRHGIRRTIRKQSQPSRPIVKPTTVSHSF